MDPTREDAFRGEDGDSSGEGGGESPTTGDKIVLGASIAGATLGACLAGPLGAIVGLRVGGGLAVAGVEKFEESDVENRVKNALHELRQNATTLRMTANLSQASFYAIVDHLNLMTARYTAPLDRRIVFSVLNVGTSSGQPLGDGSKSPPSGLTKNWKKNVFVKCRVLKTGDVWEILSARRLTLSQFVLLHEQFIAQISLDTCYENCTNANDKSTPDDDHECDDDGAGDEPIAVSTGIIDEMGFEHLEILESPRRRKKSRDRLSAENPSTGNALSPTDTSPPTPASPPNTPAITTPKVLSFEAGETLTGVESALRDVVKDGGERLNEEGTTTVEGADSQDGEEELGAVGGTEDDGLVGKPTSSSKTPSHDVEGGGDDDDDDSCGKKKDPSSSTKGRDICCICMESEAAVILPCYHSFCETCIDAWVASRRSTCPLCRSKLGTRNDRWQVVEELPPDFDVKTEIGRTMLHMALNCGKPFEGL